VKRLIPAAATLAVFAPSAHALTHSQTTAYGRAYWHVRHDFGPEAAGCKLIGPGASCRGLATDTRILKSTAVLDRMFVPAPVRIRWVGHWPIRHFVGAAVQAAPTWVPSPQGAAGVPACASESGTDYSTGPDNTNASSGATGRYQIIPSTAAAYGCDLSSPAGQDACAQRIYRGQGASAWVGCGG
jgi:hypothetical protein